MLGMLNPSVIEGLLGGALAGGIGAYAMFIGDYEECRRELEAEKEKRHQAECQLILITASIQREGDLRDLQAKHVLHSKHLDTVEARIDTNSEKANKRIDKLALSLASVAQRLTRISKRKPAAKPSNRKK